MYQIKIPGALYAGLQERDAFHNDNDTDRKALAAFNAAEPHKVNAGYSYTLTGDGATITYILDYLHTLAQAMRQGAATMQEIGVSARRLENISLQRRLVTHAPSTGAST